MNKVRFSILAFLLYFTLIAYTQGKPGGQPGSKPSGPPPNKVQKGEDNSPQTQDISFRFALFTDLHVSMTNEESTNDLINAVTDLNNQRDIAFVLISGDLTETGDYASLVKVKDILDKLNCKYYIIPGNHETKWSESGATDFARVFGDDKFRTFMNGYLFLGFNTGPVIKMGDGHVAPQDIQWVTRQLKEVGKKQPVFLVTHYPLKTGDVDNWYELTDAVRRYNIQAFFGGHYHRNLIFSYDGIPGIILRSTLRSKDELGGYTIFNLRDSLYVYEKKIGKMPIHWYSLPLEQKVYIEGDAKAFPRPDFSVNKHYRKVQEVWSKNFKKGIYGSPAVSGNKVFYGDDLGFFNCLSLDKGKLLWQYKTRSRIANTPAVADGKVVFGSCDYNIYCLNQEDGKLLWRFATKNAVLGSALIENNTVYIGGSDGSFRALDLTTGTQKWEFNQLKGYVESRPVIADDKVIFGAWDTNLYALNKETGDLVWKWNNGHPRLHFSPAAVYPVVANGKVFITAPDRYFTALDATTGKEVWRTKAHQVRETVGISEDKQQVYSRCMNDSIVAIKTTTDTPEVLWKIDAQYGYDHNACMPIEQNGMVVSATKNGEITAVRATDGAIIWKHKIGNCIINTLVPVSDTDWVLTTTNGIVARISAK